MKISRDDTRKVLAVALMSRDFHSESMESGPFDAARVSMFLTGVCMDRNSIMLVALDEHEMPSGFLVAKCGENYLTGERTAEETAIYVRHSCRAGHYGNDLFKAFENWAINEMKATRIRVTAQSSLRPDAVGRMFARRGYREVERSYTKEVNA